MERVVKLRKELGLSQKEFAEKVGIHQPEVSRIESDDVKQLTPRLVFLISKAFNVSVDWLENGLGSIFNPETAQESETPNAPYNYALAQGLGTETARLFARLCNMSPAQKESVENVLNDKRFQAFAALFFD